MPFEKMKKRGEKREKEKEELKRERERERPPNLSQALKVAGRIVGAGPEPSSAASLLESSVTSSQAAEGL